MLAPPIPPDEAQRLEDLRHLEIALTEPDESFDRMTRELARIFEVPTVSLSFMESDTQYNKSTVGMPPEAATEPRELSVCSYVVGLNDMLVVEDLLADERFRDNPFVVSSGARFYAGTPLRSKGGRALGSLCVIDQRPRTLSTRERDLLRLFADAVMTQVDLHLASRRLLDRTRQIERDLHQAVHVQRALLPPERIEADGWRITHRYRPFEHLGGDFLDAQRTPEGRWTVLIADVSGHGTSAALTAAMTKTAFLRAVAAGDSPAELLNAIHRELGSAAHPGQFMTALAATLDPRERRIVFASAGHPQPLIVGPERVETVSHENEVLLLLDRPPDYRRQTTVELRAGERLLMYTDGAFEVTDPEGNFLGIDGLVSHARAAVRSDPGDFLTELMSRLRRYAGNRFEDDVALLCIEAVEGTRGADRGG